MNKGFRYSIINAVLRPEISEQISVGMIIVDGDEIDVRYSQQKLDALHGLLSAKECDFLTRVVTSLQKKQNIKSVDTVNYLTRYSNNLIAVSPLQRIDIASTEQTKERLFRNNVYDDVRSA